jgi:hypothetical protein
MSDAQPPFRPGDQVKIVQQIPQRDGECWLSQTTGTVVRYEQAKTGSWYAHSRGERLWLDRLTLRQDDGEVIVLNLDQYTHVERADGKRVAAPAEAPTANTEVEGDEAWRISGADAHGRGPGEGVPDTPSGDLGQPSEPK